MRRAQLSVAGKTAKLNGSFLLLCQGLSECCLTSLERPFLVKVTPLGVVSILQYCLCAESIRFPNLVRKKESFSNNVFMTQQNCISNEIEERFIELLPQKPKSITVGIIQDFNSL